MASTRDAPRRGVWGRLYHGETAVNFIGRRRLWFTLSAAVILIGLTSVIVRQFNLGLDFRGGTSWEVKAPGVSVSEARAALEMPEAKIQTLGGDTLKVQADPEHNVDQEAVTQKLAELAGASPDDVALNDVGPSWGKEVTAKAQRALILFLIAVTIYIALRFEWKMALATLAALFHDVLVTAGVYSLFQIEVTPATVVAVLTILGYSIYDGIVVFDRVDENTRGLASSGSMTYGDMVDLSLNQVLMRTLNTSITALIPISSLLVVGAWMLGATTLEEFAIALLVGLGASAYSSIFIASPLLVMLKEREPRYAAIKQRIAARGAGAPERAPLTPAAAAAAEPAVVPTTTNRTGPKPGPAPRPPRPRKRGRRR